jgi:hypothetical protein
MLVLGDLHIQMALPHVLVFVAHFPIEFKNFLKSACAGCARIQSAGEDRSNPHALLREGMWQN